jgi:preprotein translocase subunit SecA
LPHGFEKDGLSVMEIQQAVNRFLVGLFGSRNERIIRRYAVVADRIEALEPEFRAKSPEDLLAVTEQLRQRLRGGETAWDVLPEAFAALREASRRARQHRHFKVQLVGGMVLYNNDIAEMRTGEGKTIVCHLSIYLKSLEGKKAHVITHNDYLVQRDAGFAAPIFELLGLRVGYIQAQVDPGGIEGVRREAYAADITYGTNSEFGFDYLRDNMKMRLVDQVQGRLDYAVVDEVDSLLIDEARTPLIISGPAIDDANRYRTADHVARTLVRKQGEANNATSRRLAEWAKNGVPGGLDRNPKFHGAVEKFKVDPLWINEDEAEAIQHTQYFVVERDRKAAHLAHEGINVAQAEMGIGSLYSGANMDWPHMIENALRAHVVYERDRDYAVVEGEVIIVDEFTGRLMYGRQWSEGLHQSVEAKENVRIKEETQTVATITIQNFFKLYKELAGMTGTAMTEADEFMKIYKLEVLAIPTNRPVNRVDHNDKIYKTSEDKYRAIVDEIHAVHSAGTPEDLYLVARVLDHFAGIYRRLGQETGFIDEALQEWQDGKGSGENLWNAYERAAGDVVVGRPVLVGTTSIEKSETLSAMLTRVYGIEHEVLNAKFHAREAEIVAKAGQQHPPASGKGRSLGNVTIATNMAGRGTDIKLAPGVVYPKCIGSLGPGSGTPEQQARRGWQESGVTGTKCCIHCPDYDPKTNCAHCWKPQVDPRFPAMGRKICPLLVPCGLHIVGTERHEARRIDNQLRGRSGRQGDPGSSRFFLSLQDELLKLFMGEWTLKMLNMLGFEEGMAIEDRRVSKGIERAQKKVEERNFAARKNLLEYDEVMDHQRRIFYGQRQQLLEGRELSGLIWDMIDESIAGAVDRFLAPGYPAESIAEWCRASLEVSIQPSKLSVDDYDSLVREIREAALDAAREQIDISMNEYVAEDTEPQDWDLRGLGQWAQTRWGVQLSQNQLRKMQPDQIRDALLEAADRKIGGADLAPVKRWLDPLAGKAALAEWARGKFQITVEVEELASLGPGDVEQLMRQRVRAGYREREIRYPVEYAMEMSIGQAAQGQVSDVYAIERLRQWVKRKFDIDWTDEYIRARNGKQLYDELVEISRKYTEDGQIDQQIDRVLQQPRDQWVGWARQRFGPAFREEAIEQAADPREGLLRTAREMLRYELTMLEQVVLLRIYDQAWKDHLYAMDRLKESIGLRGYAERDPKIEYKREGFRMFQEMMSSVRENVTDIIFKVQVVDESAVRSVYRIAETRHADATGAGLAAEPTPDQQAAMRSQGTDVPQRVQQIRRDVPKVGRNDPCPCGSGKKYKKCHGRGAGD